MCGIIHKMMQPVLTIEQATNLSALTLAYVGDAVQTLYVRQTLATNHDYKPENLHRLAVQKEKCSWQANVADRVEQSLSPQELDVFHRGRNAKTSHQPKNGTVGDYRKATGFEAVLGWLYLTGQKQRLYELLGELNVD